MSEPVKKLGLLGSGGRMGQWVQKLLVESYGDRFILGAAPKRGEPLEPLLDCDAVIDFSLPEAALPLIDLALSGQRTSLPVFAIGSTGWKIDERRRLELLAAQTLVLASSNFSLGVATLLHALRLIAPPLLSRGYVPTIVERHHVHKKDMPSGTALSLQRAIAPAGPGNVQTVSLRVGEVIGDHEVRFVGPRDELVFAHLAQERSIFAQGALDAALWLLKQKESGESPGKLLSMENLFD
jgi:4-hydroxy-tetrahydrodipicolinate reductase